MQARISLYWKAKLLRERKSVSANIVGAGKNKPAGKQSRNRQKKQLQAPENFPSDSVGLLNVSKRIALLYGESWNMKIFSKKGKGTFLKIEILLKEEKEGSNE